MITYPRPIQYAKADWATDATGYAYVVTSGPQVGQAGTFTVVYTQVGDTPPMGRTHAQVNVSYTHDVAVGDPGPNPQHELFNLDTFLGTGASHTATVAVRADWRYVNFGGIDVVGERLASEAVLATGDLQNTITGGRGDFTIVRDQLSLLSPNHLVAGWRIDLAHVVAARPLTVRVTAAGRGAAESGEWYFNLAGTRYIKYDRTMLLAGLNGWSTPGVFQSVTMTLSREGQLPFTSTYTFPGTGAPAPTLDAQLMWRPNAQLTWYQLH